MLRKTWHRLAALVTTMLITIQAHADLPEMGEPTRGEGDGLLEMLQNYMYDGAILVGLGISAAAFFVVANAVVGKFHEVHSKKATWTDFFTILLVGGILLVLVIWLATKAAEIL